MTSATLEPREWPRTLSEEEIDDAITKYLAEVEGEASPDDPQPTAPDTWTEAFP